MPVLSRPPASRRRVLTVCVSLLVGAAVLVGVSSTAGAGVESSADEPVAAGGAPGTNFAEALPAAPAAPTPLQAPTVPHPPAALPLATTRASGLPWASGVFSHDAARTTEFAAARDRPVDVLAVFPTRDSWPALLDPWWMSLSAVPAGFEGTLNVGLPLFPGDGSLEAAARGEYDGQWRAMGELIASRYPDAYVRPGWEFNIENWPWRATPENVETWKEAFRRSAVALKQGGPGLRIVWNPNEGVGNSLPDAALAYPGDDVVDIVGIDAYDWYPAYSGGGWEEHRTKDQGWDHWAGFTRAHGKRFAVPEWGVMSGSSASGGDNPEYIEHVIRWMNANAPLMEFETYFEETEEYCRCALSQNPAAQAAYTETLVSLVGGEGLVRDDRLDSPVAAEGQSAQACWS